MSTYVSTPERARQTPAGQLRARIRELEQLAGRVLARTAITPGRRYWTCARFSHSIDPRDFVHTAGPCGDDTTPEPDHQARA